MDFVADLIADPQVAVDRALGAIDRGDSVTLSLIAQVQPDILRLGEAPMIVTVLHFAVGQHSDAISVASRARELMEELARRAHLVHLRRYQAKAAPLLPAEGAAALAEVIAAYGVGL